MNDAVLGRVHSFESCGMVDGPGIRFVVFLQGCPLRCLFCHNPDSWKGSGGQQMSAIDVVNEAGKYKTWMQTSGGGITLSGGEPLAQVDFTLDIIRKAHRKNIHVALDTSGYGKLERIRPCLDEADLILLDIKTVNPFLHKSLTGVDASTPRETLEYLKKIGKPLWIRHVLVPGLTDKPSDLEDLLQLLKTLPDLKRFDLLPFHKMGEEKWESEGLEYKLKETPAPNPDFIEAVKVRFRQEGIPMGED
ncbi:MAG: pyruvate formate-lyase 1-activating enzyme [Spirochaetaceae bacterium 4572_59]|nr:MAG: pyruvate formate-lyase 1-activating enzyme [Spirochaetaceae bacterium 4572_59]